MFTYRVTKYNPDHRNDAGHYQKNEWICPSEMGESFDGVRFEAADYFKVEQQYIAAVMAILNVNAIDHLRVIGLSDRFMDKKRAEKASQWLVDDEFDAIELFEDKQLDVAHIEVVIKMILRGFIDCRLEINEKISIYFGWDFYMYVLCESDLIDIIATIEKRGIYIEEDCKESYDMRNCEFSIQVVDRNEGQVIEDTLPLEGMTRDKIRQGLGLSQEHTANHRFLITAENQALFDDAVAFDFANKNYYLDCDKLYI